jgi:acetyltransferase-like isoleucine patch superfamily enzyme
MIGEYTSIRDQDHRTDSPGPTREAGYITAPVRIGTDAWIGRGCAVLKGVTIGDRAVIGANSIVTRDVPADEVWFGAPARLRRSRSELNPT